MRAEPYPLGAARSSLGSAMCEDMTPVFEVAGVDESGDLILVPVFYESEDRRGELHGEVRVAWLEWCDEQDTLED